MSFISGLTENDDYENSLPSSRNITSNHPNYSEFLHLNSLISAHNDQSFIGVDCLVEIKTDDFLATKVEEAFVNRSKLAIAYLERSLRFFCKLCHAELSVHNILNHSRNLEHAYRYIAHTYPIEFRRIQSTDFDHQLCLMKSFYELLTQNEHRLPPQIPEIVLVSVKRPEAVIERLNRYANEWKVRNPLMSFEADLTKKLIKYKEFNIFKRNNHPRNDDPDLLALISRSKAAVRSRSDCGSLESLNQTEKKRPRRHEPIENDNDAVFDEVKDEDAEFESESSQQQLRSSYTMDKLNEQEDEEDDEEQQPRSFAERNYQFNEEEDEYASFVQELRTKLLRVINDGESYEEGFITACTQHFEGLEIDDLDLLTKIQQLFVKELEEQQQEQ